MKLYHSQANKLIVDNKEYDIIDETENKKDTDVSVRYNLANLCYNESAVYLL
ncbi:hypothetical protein EfmAA290_13660 [Enterococcus faecium]|nr:hypothetical protein EfmAA290_13660 [Enterococcus faecium]